MLLSELPHVALPVGCISTFFTCIALVVTQKWHGKLSMDGTDGIQKFHTTPTPRIGGLAIFFGLICAWLFGSVNSVGLLGPMLIAGLPAFIFGFAEDLTKRVSVRHRLFATMASGILAWHLTGLTIIKTEVWALDLLLTFLPFSVLFTAFAVGGIANAINIIDGFNGLASGAVLICLTAIGLIAFEVHDFELARLCFILGGVTFGFLVVNFPFGKIFLGDGGAYLLGFLLAWVAVMLPIRNPSVSAWSALLACGYPVFETVFTIGRRYWTKTHPGAPDSYHLHSLLKIVIARKYFSFLSPSLRNSAVSPFAWAFSVLPAYLAVSFFGDTSILMFGALGSFIVYSTIYWRLSNAAREIPIKSNFPQQVT